MGVVFGNVVFTYISFLSNIWVNGNLKNPFAEDREKKKFYSHVFDSTVQLSHNSYKSHTKCLEEKIETLCQYGYDTSDKKDSDKLSWAVNGEYTHVQVFNYYFVHFTFPVIISVIFSYVIKDNEFLSE
jgi:cellulose synthase/poly-beta-1,6-N-acetylglucosamine synthase-like glycosyltransferase